MNLLLMLGAAVAQPPAAATPQPEPVPIPQSIAAEAASEPLVFDIRYKADVLSVVGGGLKRGTRYIDNLDVTLAADLERLAGLRRTRAFVYGLYNNGTAFSSTLAGDAQVISSIETGVRAVRLFEAWVEHGDDALSVRAGLYDINTEFDALVASAMFVHSAQGTGTDLSQSGNNGPSIFPFTAPGVRVQGRVAPGLTLRAAVLEGTPGDPEHPGRTELGVSTKDGAFLIGEADWQVGDARLIVGGWRYTARFALRSDERVTGRGNDGAYIRGEARLAGDDRRGAAAFFRLGVASGRFNLFDRFAGGGINVHGLLRGDGLDAAGLAFAHARTSSGVRAITPGMTRGETALELTYRTRLNPHVWVQPDLQYIIDPSAANVPRNTWVAGLRFELRLRP